MHVLHLAWEYPPHIVGGLGRHVAELLPALASEGVRVSVVAPRLRDGAASETADGIIVRRTAVPSAPGADYPTFVSQAVPALIEAARALQAEHGRFDLVHAHDWLSAEVAIALKHEW